MKDKVLELSKNKKVALFGKGVSTLSAKKLLDFLEIDSVFYSPDDEEFNQDKAQNHALVIYSPSFKQSHTYLEIARENGTTCLCESDFSALLWQGEIIAISGTNGKTTSTSFLCHCLNNLGQKAVEAGNIGTPLSEHCVNLENFGKGVTAVYELSSFQLMDTKYIEPKAYIWTNFDEDHLDWHSSMLEYFEAKLKLAKHTDIFLVGRSVEEYAKLYSKDLPAYTQIIDRQNAPAPFDNNIQNENYSLVKALLKKLGFDIEKLSKIASTFKFAKYRFSKSLELNGISFYNDSKATNTHATIAALNSFENELIWIGGGKNKHCDLGKLADLLAKKAKLSILMGESAKNLKDLLDKRGAKAKIVYNLNEAVKIAYENAKNGDNILFSPSFSSFGMFANYIDRGNCFEREILSLK
ncbi:MAG: UDP-N-acetylmuramoyl-L-alanine--D-glutamate ligase [Opitutales bacterium]